MGLISRYNKHILNGEECYKLTEKGKKMYLEYKEETSEPAAANRD